MGLIKKHCSEEELFKNTLENIDTLLDSNRTPDDKIFAIHRAIAYFFKEASIGQEYTWSVRITAVISNGDSKPVFNSMHFSFPFYWIFEGKMDSVR